LKNAEQGLAVQKTVGEAFTGGRSTPVFEASLSIDKAPLIICKLVELGAESGFSPREEFLARSYAMEARFYARMAPELRVLAPTCAIPACLGVETEPKRGDYAFALEDLRVAFPRHPDFLKGLDAELAVSWIANFHGALFAAKARHEALQLLARNRAEIEGPGGWMSGAFWSLGKCSLRSGNPNDSKPSSSWPQCSQYLGKKQPAILAKPGIKTLGARVNNARIALNALLHPMDNFGKEDGAPLRDLCLKLSRALQDFVTVIHGDLKAANLFLSDESCAGVDFQFTGLGLGCVDIAYLCFPDAKGDYFEDMAHLVEHYWGTLVEICPRFAALPPEKLLRLVELAQVDMFRYYLERGWVPASDRDVTMIERIETTLAVTDNHEILSAEAYAEAFLAEFT